MVEIEYPENVEDGEDQIDFFPGDEEEAEPLDEDLEDPPEDLSPDEEEDD